MRRSRMLLGFGRARGVVTIVNLAFKVTHTTKILATVHDNIGSARLPHERRKYKCERNTRTFASVPY